MATGIAYVSIGVTDMASATRLWVDNLGLEVVARRSGADAGLGRLWALPAEQFVEQVVLRTPGATTGYLHLVQFSKPDTAVRHNAAPTDFGAKNIDVNCVDMPRLVAALSEQGYSFRSAISEYTVDDLHAREVQMPVHDDVNVVLIEILSDGYELPLTPRGYAALTSFIVIVPDTRSESAFYQALFGFDEIMHHRLSGPGIEAAVGLPPGSALDMRLCGMPDNLFGRMELITYEGMTGANRFAGAVPPATGILRCGFRVASAEAFIERAAANHVTLKQQPSVETLLGSGHVFQLVSPAGLQLEVLAPA